MHAGHFLRNIQYTLSLVVKNIKVIEKGLLLTIENCLLSIWMFYIFMSELKGWKQVEQLHLSREHSFSSEGSSSDVHELFINFHSDRADRWMQ